MPKKRVDKGNLTYLLIIVAVLVVAVIFLAKNKKENVFEKPKAEQYINVSEELKKADNFYNKGKYVRAIEVYKKVTQAEPQNYAANIGLGRSFIALNILDEALKTFQKTFSFRYYDYRSFYGLGLTYYSMENYPSAYYNLKQAYALNTNNQGVASYLINTYNALGLYDEAINLSQENLKKDTINSHHYRKIAVAYFFKNNFSKALENAKKAVEIDNAYAPNHLVLGIIYLSLNNQSALSEFKYALSFTQSNAAYESLAISYSLLSDSQNSDTNSKSASLQQKHSFSLALLGFALLNAKQYDKAVNEFNSSIINTPNYYLPYKGLGKVYMALGQKDKAVENLERAWELNNLDKETKEMLGKLNSK